MVDVNKFESMQIGLASPDKIRSWSYGEVKSLTTLQNFKPEKMVCLMNEFSVLPRIGNVPVLKRLNKGIVRPLWC